MTWRLGPVDQRTRGGRPSAAPALAVPWPSGNTRLLSLLGMVVGALILLAAPVPAASAADACANAQYRTGWSAQLPDCRAYELVTDTAFKGGQSLLIAQGSGFGYPMPSGNQAYWGLVMPVGDARGSAASAVASSRGSDGWSSHNFNPPSCSPDVWGVTNAPYNIAAVAADLSSSLFKENGVPNCDDPRDQAGKDLYWVDPVGAMHWVSQNGAVKTANVTVGFAGASLDLRHVFFTTTEKLVPSVDANRAVSARGLYERVDGQTRAVGVDNAGQALNVCGATGAGGRGSGVAKVSPDGRVVYFATGTSGDPSCSVANGGGQIYARIDGQRTVHVAASRRTLPVAPTVAPKLLGTSADGRWAFFSSKDQLTDDATPGGGLYRYDLGAVVDGTATSGELTFLTPQTADPAGPNVNELVATSEDGSIAYFTAIGDLVPGAPTVLALYRYDAGGVSLVSDRLNNTYWPSSSVSRDGRWLVYLAFAPDGSTQLYRYDGNHPGKTVCVSCPTGTSTGNTMTIATGGLNDRRALLDVAMPWVTEDGRAFFTSPDRLAAGDVNDVNDVYEYDGQRPRLLSAGAPNAIGSILIGTAGNGRDVFIATTDTLLPSDADNGDEDIYVARVGGGFPQPTPPVIPCAGDECQPPAPAPILAAPGSVAFVAPFAPAPRPAVAPKAEAKKVSVKRPKTVRGKAKVRLSVKAPESGRIRVSGSGLRRAMKTAQKAKSYRVTVKLSKRSKRILRRKHRVKVQATVRFTPKHGKRSRVRVRVTFKTKKHHGKVSRRSHDRANTTGRKGGR